jgi:hypothetical protein
MLHSLREFLREIKEDFVYFLRFVAKGDPEEQARRNTRVSKRDIRNLLKEELSKDETTPPQDGK